mgnify:FL=1
MICVSTFHAEITHPHGCSRSAVQDEAKSTKSSLKRQGQLRPDTAHTCQGTAYDNRASLQMHTGIHMQWSAMERSEQSATGDKQQQGESTHGNRAKTPMLTSGSNVSESFHQGLAQLRPALRQQLGRLVLLLLAFELVDNATSCGDCQGGLRGFKHH